MAGPGDAPEVGRVSLRVMPDTTGFRRELKAKIKAAVAGLDESIRVKADLDTSKVRQSLKDLTKGSFKGNLFEEDSAFLTQFNAQLKRTRTEGDKAAQSLRKLTGADLSNSAKKLQRDMAAFARAETVAIRSTNKLSLALNKYDRQVEAGRPNLRNRIKDMLGLGDSANKTRKGFLGMSRMATLALAGFTALIPLVASAAGLLAGIPALLGAAISPILGLVGGLAAGLPSLIGLFGVIKGTISLGTRGITEAVKVLEPALEKMKSGISDVFQANLPAQFKRLIGFFPPLTRGMRQTARELVGLLEGLLDVVATQKGLKAIRTVIEGTNKFLRDMRPTAQSIARTFLVMSAEGAKHLGLLSGVINRWTADVERRVARAIKSGDFKGALLGLSQTVEAVLGLFNDLVDYGVTAMRHLGGPLASFINGFRDGLTSLGRTGAVKFLKNVGGLFRGLAPAVRGFTGAFLKLALQGSKEFGSLSAAMKAIGHDFNDMVNRVSKTNVLKDALRSLADITKQLGLLFNDVFEHGLFSLASIGDEISEVIKGFRKFWAALQPLADPIIAGVLSLLAAVLEGMVPILNALTPLARGFGNALKWVADQIKEGGFLGVLLQGLLGAVLGFKLLKAALKISGFGILTRNIGKLVKALKRIGPVAAVAGGALGNSFAAGAATSVASSKNQGRLRTGVGKLVRGIGSLAGKGFGFLIGLDIANQIYQGLTGRESANLLEDSLLGWKLVFQEAFGDGVTWNGVTADWDKHFQTLYNTTGFWAKQARNTWVFWNTDAANRTSGIWSLVPQHIARNAGAAAESARHQGQNAKNAWLNAMRTARNGTGTAWNWISAKARDKSKQAADAAKTNGSWMARVWRDGAEGAKRANDNAWSRLVAGSHNGGRAAVNAAALAARNASNAIRNNTGNWFSLGRWTGLGFANGIASAAGQAAHEAAVMAAGAWNAVRNFLGVRSPSRLMMTVGRWTAIGFADGITDNVKVVTRAMAQIGQAAEEAGRKSFSGFGFADVIRSETPAAIAAAKRLSKAGTLTVDRQSVGNDFVSTEDKIAAALSGWSVEIDKFGLARLVSSANRSNRYGR